jgi:hypothetical protein
MQSRREALAEALSRATTLKEKLFIRALMSMSDSEFATLGEFAAGLGGTSSANMTGLDISGNWGIGTVNSNVVTFGSDNQLRIVNGTPSEISIGDPLASPITMPFLITALTVLQGGLTVDTLKISGAGGPYTVNKPAYGEFWSTNQNVITAGSPVAFLNFGGTAVNSSNVVNLTLPTSGGTVFALPVGTYSLVWRIQLIGTGAARDVSVSCLSGTMDGSGAGVITRTGVSISPAAGVFAEIASSMITKVTAAATFSLVSASGYTPAILTSSLANLTIQQLTITP